MTAYKTSRNTVFVLILLLLIGALAGSAASEALGPYLPFLKSTAEIGFSPFALNLHFMAFTIGFKMLLTPLTALGLIAGYWVYRRI